MTDVLRQPGVTGGPPKHYETHAIASTSTNRHHQDEEAKNERMVRFFRYATATGYPREEIRRPSTSIVMPSVQLDLVHKETPRSPGIIEVASVQLDPVLRKLLLQLAEILCDEDEAERSTQYAFIRAFDILWSAQLALANRKSFPDASIAPTESGDIFVTWRNNARRKVHLFAPASPEQQAYIYHEDENSYAVDYDDRGEVLANWLDWYLEA